MNDKSFGKDLRFLMRKLLLGYRKYFTKSGVLNSDGRRLLEEILRFLVYEHPEYRDLAYKVRREPTLENIVKVAELFMERDEIEELISLGIYGPYIYHLQETER